MLAAIGQAIAVTYPIEQGCTEGQKDQCADLNLSHVVCSWCSAGGGSGALVVFVWCFV